MAVPLVSPTIGLNRSISDSRDLLLELQNQLATGKKVTSYGDLGIDRTRVLSFRSELSQIQGYQDTISHADIRLDIMGLTVDRVREVASVTRTDALATGFELHAAGQTIFQSQVAARFDEVVSLLNTETGGRQLFAGRDTEAAPVRPASEILNGVGGQAGFRQVADERRQADLGADLRGRLVVPALVGATSSIAEDVAGHPFGFKLASVGSTLAGTAVTGPAGAPANIDVTFSVTLPNDGETLQLTLDLPDGTNTTITLTARAGTTTVPGEFEIGVDEFATAANFRAALDQAVLDEGARELSAASLFAATTDFFDFDAVTPPQRVVGPPFTSATALTNATTANTVFWYEGEISTTPARQSAIARADDSISVAYGVRGNEQAFTTVMKQFAALAVETFSASDPAAGDRYQAIKSRAAGALGFPGGAQSVDSVATELTIAKTTLGNAAERHTANSILVQGFVDDAENADIYEVSTQILALSGRIEASIQVSASLSRLSLLNFI